MSADTKTAIDASSKSGGSAGSAAVACANGKAIVQRYLYERQYKCVDVLAGHTGPVFSVIELKYDGLALGIFVT